MHADKVVRVHDRMNESVQENRQVDIAVVVYMRVEPVKEKDGNMMIDMQEGQLTPLFPQDNKDGIPKVPNFGHVKEPQEIGQGWIGLTVRFTWQEAVAIAIRQQQGFDGHVRTQHNLRDIVNELNRVWINGRNTQTHDQRTQHHKEKVG